MYRRNVIVVERKEIQKVTCQLVAGDITPSDFQILHGDVATRQQRMLDPSGCLQVTCHPGVVFFQLPVQRFQRFVLTGKLIAAGREFLVDVNQLRVLGNGVFERTDQQIQNLLTARLNDIRLPFQVDFQGRCIRIVSLIFDRRVEQRRDTSEQVFRFVRLGNVIVRTRLQTLNDVLGRRKRAEQNQRYSLQYRIILDVATELVPVHHGHLDVADDQIGRIFFDQIQRFLAIVAPANVIIRGFEPLDQHLRLNTTVLGDHDPDGISAVHVFVGSQKMY